MNALSCIVAITPSPPIASPMIRRGPLYARVAGKSRTTRGAAQSTAPLVASSAAAAGSPPPMVNPISPAIPTVAARARPRRAGNPDGRGAGEATVEAIQQMGPGGATNDLYVIGAEGTPYAGMQFIQLSESGGTTSGGEPESDLNRCWITWDGIAFYIVDDDKRDWPVTWIKWHGAAAFAEFYGWRLPTEAEWEYAASAGGALTYATSTGEIDDTLVNYNGDQPGVLDEEGHVEAVKTYPANTWGLYEMSGNAWEWCQDWYADDYYTNSPESDPLNLDGVEIPGSLDSAKRIRRGGRWNYHTATMAAAARASDDPFRGNNHFGLRVAR